jgi:hypothetical protein
MDLNIFILLLIKHAIVDIGIQRMQTNLNKISYKSHRAHYHYGSHGLGTFIVFMLFTGPVTALIAGLLDWVAHWHIDWAKHTILKKLPTVKSHSISWWWVTAIDQIFHYLTYYLLVILL